MLQSLKCSLVADAVIVPLLAFLLAFQVLGLYLHELGQIKGPKPSSCRCAPLTEAELMIPGAFMRGFKCKCEI